MRAVKNNINLIRFGVDANEIWGIDFFWTKNLKVDKNELKKVSEKVMRLEENKKDIN